MDTTANKTELLPTAREGWGGHAGAGSHESSNSIIQKTTPNHKTVTMQKEESLDLQELCTN